MISTPSILAEYIRSLGPSFKIDAILDNGVSFYTSHRTDLKFTLAIAPMFGISKGQVGLIVTRNGYINRDEIYRLEDPDLLNLILKRVMKWTKDTVYI